MTPASTLAIWTPPAAYGDLRETLRVVRPAAVYVYATDPGPMTLPKAVIEQVAGMVKYALRTAGGMATLDRMAAACAQREATTRAALTVLAAQGEVVVLDEGGVMQFAPGTGVRDEAELLRAVPILKALINETALFRAHWAAASIEALTADLRS